MIDRTYVGKTKYSYKDLLKKELPEDVNPQHKEVSGEVYLNSHARKIWLNYFMNLFDLFLQHNLSEKQFREAVKYPRDQFYRLPVWKQEQLFKSARLGHTSSSENPYRLRIESPDLQNDAWKWQQIFLMLVLYEMIFYSYLLQNCAWLLIYINMSIKEKNSVFFHPLNKILRRCWNIWLNREINRQIFNLV